MTTQFYLKTSETQINGPFTGIELREAALANLILPSHEVAVSSEGPWTIASSSGLFSESNEPLPHPPGTPVPEFQLKGVHEAFEGPFKLRELIDLAVRKMLSSNALIQPLGRPDWVPANQLRILDVCMRGELAPELSGGVAPLKTPLPDPSVVQMDGAPPIESLIQEMNPDGDIDAIVDDHRAKVRKNIRKNIAKKSESQLKIVYTAAIVAAVLLVIGGLAWWISLPPAAKTVQSKAVGNWVLIPNQNGGTAFGVSFKDDGTCVVVNANGRCWYGNYQWSNDAAAEAENPMLGPLEGRVNEVASDHQGDVVNEDDGYVRFVGATPFNAPMLVDKRIRECFIRRDGDYLWLGYLAGISEDAGVKSVEAGWVQLWPRNRMTISGSINQGMRGNDLLSRYGVPDEARTLRTSEITANREKDTDDPRAMFRYGTVQLVVFADGSVRPYIDTP
ncbi:MAG: hypothetical protein AAGG48_27235 [Planctomycetota bacterium]